MVLAEFLEDSSSWQKNALLFAKLLWGWDFQHAGIEFS
jgi:hypothetical protein